MEYTLEEKYKLIKEMVLKSSSKNPVEISTMIMHEDFINIHGPEHHYLDGAAFLVAYYNATQNIELNNALIQLANRSIKMPGAMCGHWGICGACASIGAALAIINETGPLTSNQYYKDNMAFTACVIKKMSEIGGPRCCKRNAFISLTTGVLFVNSLYGASMELEDVECEFSNDNKQCLQSNCPFYKVSTN